MVAMDGGRFNVVLTTNFDDLVGDALYLFSAARPLVIHHESLASYIRPTRTRPLVVKLHGDHRLSPQNTPFETKALKQEIEKQVRGLLHDRGLIFIGYGGNDQGINAMLRRLPNEALPLGVWWVSGQKPMGTVRRWLDSRDAVWVEMGDFDELMLLLRDVFDVPHPDGSRFNDVFDKYFQRYQALSGRVTALPEDAPDASALKGAVQRADVSFTDWWAVAMAARRLRRTDPDEADRTYREGLEQFPGSAPLLDTYAVFLDEVRKDYDGAEEHYRRALAADPNLANTLSNYANFLRIVRKDYDRAEEHFRRALAADPNNAIILGSYAILLGIVRKDYDGAEERYRRALAADPNNAINLGNYAGLLLARGKREEGLEALDRALRLPALQPDLAAECWFYALAHRPAGDRAKALKALKRLIQEGARSPGWDLTPHVERARQEKHPDIAWLENLAAVISEGAGVGVLNGWADWNKA